MDHFQVLADCPHCFVEGAIVEIFDHQAPCCHFGVALEGRCRMCGFRSCGEVEGPKPEYVDFALTEERCPGCREPLDEAERQARQCGQCGLRGVVQTVQAPTPMDSVEAVEAALRGWATEEHYASVDEMLEASFSSARPAQIFAQSQSGQRIETTFDVLGYLFAHMGGQSMQAAGERPPVMGEKDQSAPASEDDALWGFAPTARIQLPKGRMPHRRNRALALISVMAADGFIRDIERRFVEKMLTDEGLEPLADGEIRVHRPHEVGPVGMMKDREALIESMLQLAHIDGERDETEIRVIREYARAWGVDPARIAAWQKTFDARNSSGLSRFMVKIKALFLA